VCVYSLRYPACIVHAPYCHLWPAQLYIYLPILTHKRNDLGGGGLLNTKFVFRFYVQLLSETFLVLRRTQPYVTITVHISVCMYSDRCDCQIVMKLEFS
jgi:hypothetical protein